MQQYSDLLASCIDNILGKKEEIGVNSLFHRGGTSPVKIPELELKNLN